VDQFLFALLFFCTPPMLKLDKTGAAPINDLISGRSARSDGEAAEMLGMMLDLVLYKD
jgi:hypothetical protein